MLRHISFGDATGACPRGMYKRAARSTGLINDLFGKDPEIITVISIFVAYDTYGTQPATTNAYNLVAFSECPNSHRSNSRIQARNVSATG